MWIQMKDIGCIGIVWSLSGFLIYVDSKDRDKNPCLKVLYLTLYSWQTFRDKEGWWIS